MTLDIIIKCKKCDFECNKSYDIIEYHLKTEHNEKIKHLFGKNYIIISKKAEFEKKAIKQELFDLKMDIMESRKGLLK